MLSLLPLHCGYNAAWKAFSPRRFNPTHVPRNPIGVNLVRIKKTLFVPKKYPFCLKMYQTKPMQPPKMCGTPPPPVGGVYFQVGFSAIWGGGYGTIHGISSTHLGLFSPFPLVFVGRVNNPRKCVHPSRVLGASQEVSTPPPQMVCLGLLVVYLGSPLGQILDMEVGEGTEGSFAKVLLSWSRCHESYCGSVVFKNQWFWLPCPECPKCRESSSMLLYCWDKVQNCRWVKHEQGVHC